MESQATPTFVKETASVDFKKLLHDHAKRTEISLPFTIQQIGDAMFVDEKRMIALEYILYQKDGDYYRLKKDKGKGHAIHNLGTDEYDL